MSEAGARVWRIHLPLIALLLFATWFIFSVHIMRPTPLTKAQREEGIVCILETRLTGAEWLRRSLVLIQEGRRP